MPSGRGTERLTRKDTYFSFTVFPCCAPCVHYLFKQVNINVPRRSCRPLSPPSANSHSNNPDCVLCQEYDPFQGSAQGHVLEEFFLTLYTMPTSSRTPFLLPKCTCCDCTSNRLLHLFVYLSHLTRLKVP